MDILDDELAKSIVMGEVLGEGASAVTYRATDAKQRMVCVKQFKSSFQLEDRDRIRRELEVLKSLHHSRIPRVFGAYQKEINGRWLLHIVQEMVDGEDLDVWLKDYRPTLLEVQQLLAEVLGILVYLHGHQPPVIHRDIKPSNLMRRLDGSVVLIDFGQAVHDIHRTMGQTMVTGTLGYQSLEQIIGHATSKSDVYSVGVVAVELLTGLKAHTMLEGQVLRWERKCRELPLPIQEWLDKMLHQDPSQRFSAAEALSALQGMADVFVEVQKVSAVIPVNGRVSEDFLNLLEDAIEDETEEKREERERIQQAKLEKERQEREKDEAEYRKRVEEERQAEIKRQQEAVWRQREEALWAEMLGSWEQLLNTVASKRVSVEKAFEAYMRAFENRVRQAKARRNSGVVDQRVLMLWGIVQPTIDQKSLDIYWDWVRQNRLGKGIEKRDNVAKRLKNAKRTLRELQYELGALSWWGRLWKKSGLEEKIRAQSTEVASLKESLKESKQDFDKVLSFWSCDGYISWPQFYGIDCVDEMVLIPKGEFVMGALVDDSDAFASEMPRHKVTLPRAFLMGKYPVTQALWDSVMGSNRSYFKGANRPVENVSWFDVVVFCNQLSELEDLTPTYTINGHDVTCNWNATGYRLPTEAEWEYSALANQRFKYAGSDNLKEVAWYGDNSGYETHPVGQKKPNGFGLYDMSGNVFEWVWDWYGTYSSSPTVDPRGPDSGSRRVLRGGSWYSYAQNGRVSYRGEYDPDYTNEWLGFRLCRLSP